mgnify:CR=1 FL=1
MNMLIEWDLFPKRDFGTSNYPTVLVRKDIEMKSIMIVDDSSFMRKCIKNFLNKNDYEVVAEAETGIQAVEKYIQYSPDVVIMDITMPKMNGLEALREILRFDPNAKVIMLSSLGDRFNVVESLRIGAKDFVVKPHLERLNPVIQKILYAS